MEPFQLNYRNSLIRYTVFGSGVKKLYCFHGYGESGSSFRYLETVLGEEFTFVCIDFPLHGATEWKEEKFLPSDLQNIISSIGMGPSGKISILGYSMGGRIALQLLTLIPEQIDRVVLIAPDGLHKNIWYRISTQTWVGNRIFKHTARHPGWLFAFLKLADKTRLLNQSILKIAHHYLDEAQVRILLYERWTLLRKFNPALGSLKEVIAAHNIPVRLVFGKYDRIILSKRSHFLKGDSQNIRIRLLEAGHQMLQEKYQTEIAGLFYQ